MNTIHTVCVYSASSPQIDPIYMEAAKTLGRLLGEKGIRVVNGAGNTGLMRAVSDAAMAAGGTATGIIPHFMIKNNWCNPKLTEVVAVENMHERKETMMKLSDALIALPGGCGTLEELLEAITWKQLGLFCNPIVILNTNHYYDPLIEMLQKALNEQFMRAVHARLWAVASTPEEAVDLIYTEPVWEAHVHR